MSANNKALTDQEVQEALQQLDGWRYQDGGLQCTYRCHTARKALDFIAQIGDIAEAQNHHPDLDWRYNRVFLILSSHDMGGVITEKDVLVSREIAAVASELGVEPAEHQDA